MFGFCNFFFDIIVCEKAVNFEENEVNFSVDVEAKPLKKYAKVKQNKLPSESDGGDITERQRLINYILSEGYDKRNYPTNMTVKLGVALLKIDVVC